MAEEASNKPNAPAWLKVIVLLHLLVVTIWALPVPTAVMKGERQPVGTEWILVYNQEHLKTFQPIPAYLFVTGFWQYWDMFSPNPSHVDVWGNAEITYKDGTTKIYKYPRMFELGLARKYVSERYRKFYERVSALDAKNPNSEYKYLWPVYSQRIAHLCDDPLNPPVIVKLTRFTREVMPPGMRQPQDYAQTLLYKYVVDQDRLAKDRKGIW